MSQLGKHEQRIGVCERCGGVVRRDDYLCESCRHERWETRYDKDQCGNCQSYLERGDKYCRMCGTKVGEGAFEPWQNFMECIYGPMPVERTHRCSVCGYTWKTLMMIDQQRYCPKCGNLDVQARREMRGNS